MDVILESGVGGLQLAEAFDVDLAAGVDQNVGNGRIVQEGLERTQTEGLVEDLFCQSLAIEFEGYLLVGAEQALYDLTHQGAQGLLGDGIQLGKVELFDQAAVDAFLKFMVGVLALQVTGDCGNFAYLCGRGGLRRPSPVASFLTGFEPLQQAHGSLLSSSQAPEQPPAVSGRCGVFSLALRLDMV
ncbi:MAG: hypothetical protein BWY77_01961 [bacterium ADurb.Bin431]|nr:MAG: hypothetical protein BWY77_01961 [bacterium ADurb.Bin431]